MNKAREPQPSPVKGRGEVAEAVLQDIRARVAMGEEKYGTRLSTFNGREAVWDLYQELIDAVMYTKQYLLEREVSVLLFHLVVKYDLFDVLVEQLVQRREREKEKRGGEIGLIETDHDEDWERVVEEVRSDLRMLRGIELAGNTPAVRKTAHKKAKEINMKELFSEDGVAIPEGVSVKMGFRCMGYDVIVMEACDFILDDAQLEAYEQDPSGIIEEIELSKHHGDYRLAEFYDTEDGHQAVYVRPARGLAKKHDDLKQMVRMLLPFLPDEAQLLDHAALNDGRASEFDMVSVKLRKWMMNND